MSLVLSKFSNFSLPSFMRVNSSSLVGSLTKFEAKRLVPEFGLCVCEPRMRIGMLLRTLAPLLQLDFWRG